MIAGCISRYLYDNQVMPYLAARNTGCELLHKLGEGRRSPRLTISLCHSSWSYSSTLTSHTITAGLVAIAMFPSTYHTDCHVNKAMRAHCGHVDLLDDEVQSRPMKTWSTSRVCEVMRWSRSLCLLPDVVDSSLEQGGRAGGDLFSKSSWLRAFIGQCSI
jgi:hypothetical protein